MSRSFAARLADMRAAVRALYQRNRQQGVAPWCGHEYDFVCPSTGTYPFQWFWDSCFHAIVLTRFDVARAESEIRSLLKNAQPDGFVAHVTFWQREKYEEMLATYGIAYRTPHLSDCMQPPVLAEAVDAIVRRGGSTAFAAEVLPAVRRYFDWLDRVRDPDRDGLIATLQPDESGLDHTPKYDAYAQVARVDHDAFCDSWKRIASANDEAGRVPEKMFERDCFVVEDVLVNVIYAENLRLLSGLLARSGDTAGAVEYEQRARRTRDALIAKCWDERRGLFFDLAGRREQHLAISTVSSLFPLLLPDLPDRIADRLAAHLEDPARYGAEYPVPTVSREEPLYVPGICGTKLTWRGPAWMNTNWYITRGLRRHGRADLAARIEDRSAELVERYGFREYYNPETGEGMGAREFSWTALVLDMLEARVIA